MVIKRRTQRRLTQRRSTHAHRTSARRTSARTHRRRASSRVQRKRHAHKQKGGNLTQYSIEKGGNYYPLSKYGIPVGGFDPAVPSYPQSGGFNFMPRDVLDVTRAASTWVSRTYDGIIGKVPQFNEYSNPAVQPIGQQTVNTSSRYVPADFKGILESSSSAAAEF